MEQYIIFKVKGFESIVGTMGDRNDFDVENDSLIRNVELIFNEKSRLTYIKLNIKNDIAITNTVIDQISQKFQLYLSSLIIEICPIVKNLSYSIEQVHPLATESLPSVNIRVPFKMTVTASLKVHIDRFKSLFESSESCEEYRYLLLNIMQIDNIAIRFLMQYEMMLSLISPSNRVQRKITEYIKDIYNPSVPDSCKIGFETTTKPGKNYKEDKITFCRNSLGHSNLDSNYNQKVLDDDITNMSLAALRVINFRFNDNNT